MPALLCYPVIDSIGAVGEVIVSGQSQEILTYTPVDEMLTRARALYDQHHDRIEAPIS